VESGRVDLVLARSILRHWLITRSLLLFTAVPLLAGLSMAFGTWIGLHTFASPASRWPTPRIVGLPLVHLVSLGWCFGAPALAVAAGARRWSTAFASVTIGAVALYLVEVLAIGWALARTVSWASPFRYYPALPIVAGDPIGRVECRRAPDGRRRPERDRVLAVQPARRADSLRSRDPRGY
jgi:hypothetical protein